jgi:hypothetical protein
MRLMTRVLVTLLTTLLVASPAWAQGGFGRRGGGGGRGGPPPRRGTAPRAGWFDPWYALSPWGYGPYGVGGWYGGYGYASPWGPYVARGTRLPMRWDPPRQSEARFVVGGLATTTSFHPGVSLAVESDRLGLDVSMLSLTLPTSPEYVPSATPMLAAHGGWALVHRPTLRVQGELGVRGLFAEDFDYFGPDAAVAARWRFAGPFSVRAGASLMAWPVLATTADLALAFQVGAGLFELGWRGVRLDDTRVNPDGGSVALGGFLAGAGLRF